MLAEWQTHSKMLLLKKRIVKRLVEFINCA